MLLYLAVTPDRTRPARRFTDRLAHVAYRIGPEGRLSRRELPVRTQGGVMVLGDQGCGPIRDVELLCREVWQECGNRSFAGVLADFEGPFRPDKAALLTALTPVLLRNDRRLYVPERYGHAAPRAGVLICTALSGGTLRGRLDDARASFGAKRLALDLQRLRMSFPLPCPTGEGRPLAGGELETLLAEGPSVFFSADLGAKYFTCTRDGRRRFVLFDDAQTLRWKIRVGNERGAQAGFLMYPEVCDLLPEIYGN